VARRLPRPRHSRPGCSMNRFRLTCIYLKHGLGTRLTAVPLPDVRVCFRVRSGDKATCTIQKDGVGGHSVLAARVRPGLRKELHATMYLRKLKSMCERLSCLVFLARLSILYSLLVFDNLVLYIKASYTFILGDRLWPP
jgi:hypothetical protein